MIVGGKMTNKKKDKEKPYGSISLILIMGFILFSIVILSATTYRAHYADMKISA